MQGLVFRWALYGRILGLRVYLVFGCYAFQSTIAIIVLILRILELVSFTIMTMIFLFICTATIIADMNISY